MSTTSSISVTVNQTLTSVSLSPATATVTAGTTRQFTATAKDQFGAALTTQPTFVWSLLAGGGTVGPNSLYTASAVAGSATIRAASGAVGDTASIEIVSSVPPPTPTSPPPAPTAPAAPSNLAAVAVSAARIDLRWIDNSLNEAGFLIERSLDGKTWKRFAVVGTNVRSCSAKRPVASRVYYFRVLAYNGSFLSAYSNVVRIRPRSRQ